VGVGASAGGLDAFRRLLGALPAETPFALVLIQHLDPSQKSQLAEILAPECKLPVEWAHDDGALEPGHVYVVPEGNEASIAKGRLVLRPAERECRLPIDTFLSSLAAAGESQGCGVLLSGTGSDGVHGLSEIRGAGGITFAQDPETCEHADMPRAAIASRLADFMGSPEEIAAELAQLAGHFQSTRETRRSTAELERDSDTMGQIVALVRQGAGMDFSGYKQTTVRRRVNRRVMLRDVDGIESYLALLQEDSAEIDELLDDLLINVTEFFRDTSVFECLRTHVFPEILADKTDADTVRLWVAGCSTGEEVYSILITLLEALDEAQTRPKIIIFGTDASEDAVRVARLGVYPQGLCSAVSPERLNRYFVRTPGGYQIDKRLREMCVFARQDITKDTPFSRLDLVSLRNVLIYMDRDLQRKVLAVAHYALSPAGFLVLGTSETPESEARLFTAFDKQQHVYRRKDVAPRLPLDVTGTPKAGFDGYASVPLGLERPPRFDAQSEANRLSLALYAPPRIVVDANCHAAYFFGDTARFLEHPPGRATHDVLELVNQELSLDLKEALDEVVVTGASAYREVVFLAEGSQQRIAVEVSPLPSPPGEEYRLVAFRDLPPIAGGSAASTGHEDLASLYEAREERLRREIGVVRAQYRNVAGDKEEAERSLRAMQEELGSSNEELQSINEELETAKEELQSANEELITVNEELRKSNRDLVLTADDLSNVMASTEIPLLMVDTDLNVRRFTREASRLVHILPADTGRPLAHLRLRCDCPDLAEKTRDVIENLRTFVQEVQSEDGRWYSLQIRPYRSADDRVSGAVLAFLDIDELKRSMERIEERNRLSRALNEIDAHLHSGFEFSEIMQCALDDFVEALRADAGDIKLRSDGGWVVRNQHGFDPGIVGQHLVEGDAPLAQRVLEAREPVAVADLAKEPDLNVGFPLAHGVTAMLAIPLIVRDEVIGALLAEMTAQPRVFTDAEIDFANRFAASVSLAVENARLREAERDARADADTQARRMEVLKLVAEIASSTLDVGEVGQGIAAAVPDLLGANLVTVMLEDATQTQLSPVGSFGYPKEYLAQLTPTPADSEVAVAYASGKARWVEDLESVGVSSATQSRSQTLGVRSFAVFPLFGGGRTIGTFSVAWPEPHRFEPDEVTFLESFAGEVAIGLQNARLYEMTRDKAARLQTLQGLAEIVSSSLDMDAVIDAGLARIVELLGVAAASVWVLSPAKKRLRLVGDLGFSDDFRQDFADGLPLDAPHDVVRAVTSAAAVVHENAAESDVAEPVREAYARYGIPLGALVAMPLLTPSGCIGGLTLAWNEPRTFTAENVEFDTALASVFSTALVNARLFDEVRDSEEKYRGLVEQAVDGIFLADAEGHYVEVNAEGARQLGYTPEELRELTLVDVLDPDELARMPEQLAGLATGGVVTSVWRFRRKDGSVFPGEVVGRQLPDGHMLGILRDVTEREAAEKALAEARERADTFATFVENAAQPIAAGTPDGGLLLHNRAFEELTGYTAYELQQITWAVDLTPPEYREMEAGILARLARTGVPVRYEKEYIRKDGSRVPIELFVHVSHDINGEIAFYYTFFTDLTERKEAERALRESEAMLRLFIEHTPAAIAMLDNDMRYIAASRRWYSDYGVEDDDVTGKCHYDVFPDIPEEWKEIHRRVLAGAVERNEADPWPRADGHTDWVRWELRPWYRADDTIGGLIVMSENISDRVAAEQALRDSEASVRRRLYAILSPDAEVGDLDLADIVDAPDVRSMMEDFHALTAIPMAIIDLSGEVLVGVGWQDVCMSFHRAHPESCKHCIESDTELAAQLAPGESKLYRCKNGMWDMVSPIHVAGQHIGNVFTGQFFFEDELVDRDFFIAQARTYGFEEDAYIAAVDAVPRIGREAADVGMSFLAKFADSLAKLGYGTVRLARALTEREQLMASLQASNEALSASEEQFRRAIADAPIPVIMHAEDGEVLQLSRTWTELTGYEIGEIPTFEAWLSRAYAEGADEVLAHMTSLFEGGAPTVCMEFPVQTLGGEIRRWDYSASSPGTLEDGRRFAVGMAVDITERTVAEARTRRDSALLGGINRVLQGALESMSDAELGQVCLDVAEEITCSRFGFIGEVGADGLLHDIALSDPGWDACAMHDKAGHRRPPGNFEQHGLYGRVFGSGVSLLANAPSEHPDSTGTPEGHPPLTAFLGVPLKTDGRSMGMIAVANREGGYTRDDQDALEGLAPAIVEAFRRMRAEHALRESREDLNRAQAVAHTGSWRLDTSTNILSWSDETYRMFGVPLGMPLTYEIFLSGVYPEDRDYVDREWTAALSGAPYDIVHRVLTDGEVRWVRERAELEFDAAGRLLGGFGTVQEITDAKRAEEELARLYDAEVAAREEARLELQRSNALRNSVEALTSSIDLDSVLATLAELIREALQVPRIAVLLAEGDGTKLTTAITLGPDASTVGSTWDLEALSPELRSAVLSRRSTTVDYDAPGLSDAIKKRSESTGARLALWVPIIWREQLLGMVGVDQPWERREFSEREVDLITAISAQAAAAITNARQYETEHVIAETLQEALLVPPEPTFELEIAYRYIPASAVANVGGDFYDVFTIDSERSGILIGDVSGKGIEAARYTALVRSGARAYAFEDPDPVSVLTKLNNLVYRSTPSDAFATVFFGVLNRLSGTLRYCGAGHPPGLIRHSGGVEALKSRSAIVGAFPDAPFNMNQTRLDRGEMLVLFTDGVVEARRGREMFGDERAATAVAHLETDPLAEAPQRIIDEVMEFSGGVLRDDIVLLCIKRREAVEDSQ